MDKENELRDKITYYELLSQSNRVPISIVSPSGDVIYGIEENGKQDILADIHRKIIRNICIRLGKKETKYPLVHITSEKLMVAAFPCNGEDAVIFIGPVPHAVFNDKVIKEVIQRYQISDRDRFRDEISCELPRMTVKDFVSICRFAYYSEWKTDLQLSQMIFNVDMELDENYSYPRMQVSTILNTENDKVQAIPPGMSRPLVNYIMKGDSESALRYLNDITKDIDEYAPYSSSWIARFMPNSPTDFSEVNMSRLMFINSVSHIAELLAGDGFSDEQVWMLWYYYVDRALHLETVREINRLSRLMVLDFCERGIPSTQGTSYKVRMAMSYIRAHISENITAQMVAEHVDANPRYLSEQFKTEVGYSLSKYIQNERILTVKHLLIYTEESLVNISNMMDFSSQSYFTSTFKRCTGYSPDAYRETFGRLDRGHK